MRILILQNNENKLITEKFIPFIEKIHTLNRDYVLIFDKKFGKQLYDIIYIPYKDNIIENSKVRNYKHIEKNNFVVYSNKKTIYLDTTNFDTFLELLK